jgi:type II secretory pathway component PulF
MNSITLDDLIALNDEIAALVRAGVPLEEGLSALGSDVPGRLGRLMGDLAEDARRGRPLGEVLADPQVRLPKAYRAVVEAGLRAGRLPAALEAVAGSVRRLAQIRRSVALAFLYPAFVLVLAWGLFAGFAAAMAPRVASAMADFHIRGLAVVSTLASWGHWAILWGPALPIVVIVLGSVWAWRSRQAISLDAGRARWASCACLPWLGPMLRWSRAAVFCDLLATLLENRVPLNEAIPLAGEATGDAATFKASRSLAAALERGESVRGDSASAAVNALPPLLRWLIQVPQGEQSLVATLQNAADAYRSRAQYQAELAQVFLPVILTIVIGGTVTLLYTASVLGSYIAILWGLAK